MEDTIKVPLGFVKSGIKPEFPPHTPEAIKAWSKKMVAEWQAERSANNTK